MKGRAGGNKAQKLITISFSIWSNSLFFQRSLNNTRFSYIIHAVNEARMNWNVYFMRTQKEMEEKGFVKYGWLHWINGIFLTCLMTLVFMLSFNFLMLGIAFKVFFINEKKNISEKYWREESTISKILNIV